MNSIEHSELKSSDEERNAQLVLELRSCSVNAKFVLGLRVHEQYGLLRGVERHGEELLDGRHRDPYAERRAHVEEAVGDHVGALESRGVRELGAQVVVEKLLERELRKAAPARLALHLLVQNLQSPAA